MRQTITSRNIVSALLLGTLIAHASDDAPKQALKSNYQVVYNKTPQSVDSIIDMFKEGMFYGRLRSNTFLYRWEKQSATQDSHLITALGGSFVYKSAAYAHFDLTAGLYFSQSFFNNGSDPVALLKPGKDLLSRYDYANTANSAMGTLGQAYISYKGIPNTELSLGRRLVETFFTASNDTKMIPNSFDGLVLQTKALDETAITLAYLADEKLRDHTQTHSVLTYGDANSSSSLYPSWSGNDDTAMHKGLTYTRLKAAGVSTSAPLIIAELQNSSIKDLSLATSFYAVPALVSEVMAEANHKMRIDAFSLSSGVRYIKQFDNGAGKIGGASYRGTLAGKSGVSGGYKEADSLNSQMIAANVVGAYGIFKLNIGYSKVFDEADLVTPWRAFPTAGYTRSMARYNWNANTKSYRVELSVNGNKSGVYKDMFMQVSLLHTDADESKGLYDEAYYYAAVVQNVSFMPDLQWRLRVGYANTQKSDADNLDARFELDYLF